MRLPTIIKLTLCKESGGGGSSDPAELPALWDERGH
jgi:hypothetical protein